MTKKHLPVLLVVLCILGVVSMVIFSRPASRTQPLLQQDSIEYRTETLVIGDNIRISVEISDTPEKTILGLSYRESLPENSGMLFVFPEEHIPSFWMKGMNFPLDMVWIGEDNTIVDITQNVPHPDSGTPEFELPHYSPQFPAKFVLEVNGGFVEKNGIKIGDSVTIQSSSK